MSYCVYKHTFPNGKVYIGITKLKPEKRWNHGRGYDTQPLISRAIKKYGWENIEHEIIFEGLSQEEAEQKEIELIKQYNSNKKEFGYNIANGGNCIGTVSEETKKKISELQKGKKASKETKCQMSKAQKERWNNIGSKELKEKFRNNMLGDKNPFYNKSHSEEVKKNLSELHKGKHLSEETKKKISNTMIGRPLSDGAKAKISKPVRCIETNVVYCSVIEARRNTGIYHINDVCIGKRKSAGGYHWEFVR
jgi:group I intron endonuclease